MILFCERLVSYRQLRSNTLRDDLESYACTYVETVTLIILLVLVCYYSPGRC